MTTTPSPPDGAARPVRVVRAAEEAPGKLRIICSQVEPGEEDYPLTCLAHLGAETLAAASVRVADGDTRRITLARGDCASCPLASGAHDVPAQVDRAVSAAAELLARSGAGGQDLFEVVEAAEEQPAGKRRRLRSSGVSRRDLLFGGRARAGEEEGLTVPAPTAERGVLLAALPGAVVDHPVASPGCTGCRICEQVCPEKAFGWSGIGSNGLLWVSPADCTACGICVQACPEDVLDLAAVTPADAGHQLARIQPRGCTNCGRGLAPGEREVCTACASRRSLLDDVWKHLGE